MLSLEAEQIDEIPANVDLVLIVGGQLLRRVGVELDLETAAAGILLSQAGQDEEAVLLDKIAVDVEEDRVNGQVPDDALPDIVQETFFLGGEIGDHLVGGRMEDAIGRREKIEERTGTHFQVKVLESLGVKVVQDHRPARRKTLHV